MFSAPAVPPTALPPELLAPGLATFGFPFAHLSLQLRLHFERRINRVNVFAAAPARAFAIKRGETLRGERFQKPGDLRAVQVAGANVDSRAVIQSLPAKSQHAVTLVIARRTRMIADGLAQTIWMNARPQTGALEAIEGGGCHAVRPRKPRLRFRRQLLHAARNGLQPLILEVPRAKTQRGQTK